MSSSDNPQDENRPADTPTSPGSAPDHGPTPSWTSPTPTTPYGPAQPTTPSHQPSSGQSGYGQPAYGQPSSGQSGYSQPAYGQPAYGHAQPPQTTTPYGQPYQPQPYQPAQYQPQQYQQPQAYQPQQYPQPQQYTQVQPVYQPQPYPGYQSWNVPQPTPRRRIRRKPLAIAVLALVAAVVLGVISVQQYQASRAPTQVVQRYFTAIAAGKAETALDFQAVPPRGQYLTSLVLSEQLKTGKMSDIHVTQVTSSGDQASAQVDYTLALPSGRRVVHDQVPLVKRGSSWKLKSVAALVNLGVSSTGGDRVTMAGAALPQDAVYLFPGALPVDTDSSALVIDGDPNVRLADDSQSVDITVGLTAAAKKNLTATLRTALASCLNGKSTDANCPQIQDVRPVPNSLRGTVPPITSGITIALDSSGRGEVSMSGDVTVKGTWKVWDFNNQAVTKSGNTDLEVHAVASVADLDHLFWRAS